MLEAECTYPCDQHSPPILRIKRCVMEFGKYSRNPLIHQKDLKEGGKKGNTCHIFLQEKRVNVEILHKKYQKISCRLSPHRYLAFGGRGSLSFFGAVSYSPGFGITAKSVSNYPPLGMMVTFVASMKRITQMRQFPPRHQSVTLVRGKTSLSTGGK